MDEFTEGARIKVTTVGGRALDAKITRRPWTHKSSAEYVMASVVRESGMLPLDLCCALERVRVSPILSRGHRAVWKCDEIALHFCAPREATEDLKTVYGQNYNNYYKNTILPVEANNFDKQRENAFKITSQVLSDGESESKLLPTDFRKIREHDYVSLWEDDEPRELQKYGKVKGIQGYTLEHGSQKIEYTIFGLVLEDVGILYEPYTLDGKIVVPEYQKDKPRSMVVAVNNDTLEMVEFKAAPGKLKATIENMKKQLEILMKKQLDIQFLKQQYEKNDFLKTVPTDGLPATGEHVLVKHPETNHLCKGVVGQHQKRGDEVKVRVFLPPISDDDAKAISAKKVGGGLVKVINAADAKKSIFRLVDDGHPLASLVSQAQVVEVSGFWFGIYVEGGQ